MKLFVWDLHGTLEQGNEDAAVEISNRVLDQFGYTERFTPEMGKQLYGFKWYEYFEMLLPDESHERHIALQEASFKLSNSPEGVRVIAKYMRPSPNALAVLAAIRNTHDQVIISNTTPESLPAYLDALGMRQFFDTAHALAVNQHRREATYTKADALTQYLRGKRYDEVIVIGDSDGDMRLAESVGAKAYLYAHHGTAFRSERGDYKINDLIAVMDEVTSGQLLS